MQQTDVDQRCVQEQKMEQEKLQREKLEKEKLEKEKLMEIQRLAILQVKESLEAKMQKQKEKERPVSPQPQKRLKGPAGALAPPSTPSITSISVRFGGRLLRRCRENDGQDGAKHTVSHARAFFYGKLAVRAETRCCRVGVLRATGAPQQTPQCHSM